MIKKYSLILDNVILFFLSLYFFSFFSPGITAVENIALYTSIALFLVFIAAFWQDAVRNFKNNFIRNKTLIILSILAFFTVIVFSIFPYDSSFSSLHLAIRQNKKAWMIFVGLLFWYNGSKEKSKRVFDFIAFAFIFSAIMFFLRDIFGIDTHKREQPAGIIDRQYGVYFDILVMFFAVFILCVKNHLFKFMLFAFVCFAFYLDLLTGARGSWLAFVLSLLLLAWLFYKKYNISRKIFNIKSIILAIFVCVLAASVSFFNPSIKEFLAKRLDNHTISGRDIILSKRLPMLFSSHRAFIGLGHGEYQYQKFLNDNNPNKEYLGPFLEQEFENTGLTWYLHDEPSFVANYYHYGVGTIFIVILTFYIFIKAILKFRRENNYYILALALSVFSYYIIRGLFEGYNVTNLFIYSCLFLLFNYKDEKCQK